MWIKRDFETFLVNLTPESVHPIKPIPTVDFTGRVLADPVAKEVPRPDLYVALFAPCGK